MNKIRIYLGMNNPKTNKEYQLDKVVNEIKFLFDYATFYQGKGLYKNQLETTLIVELISDDLTDKEITNVCNYLKNRYQQECVMYTKDIIDIRII